MNLNPAQANFAHYGICGAAILVSLVLIMWSLLRLRRQYPQWKNLKHLAQSKAKTTKSKTKTTVQNDEISLNDLFSFIFRQFSLGIFIFAVTFFAGAVYNVGRKLPSYTATVSVALGASVEEPVTQADITLNSSLADFYPELVKSKLVIERAQKNGQLATDLATLTANTSVEVNEDSNFVYIVTTAAQPEEALRNADALAQSFLEEVSTNYGFGRLRVLDSATITATPSLEAELKDLIVFAFIGIVLALGVIFIWFYFHG